MAESAQDVAAAVDAARPGSSGSSETPLAFPLVCARRFGGSALWLALSTAGVMGLMPLINFLIVLPQSDLARRLVYETAVVAIINIGAIGYCTGLLVWVLQRLARDLKPLEPLLRVDATGFVKDVCKPLTWPGLFMVWVVNLIVWYIINIELGLLGRVLRDGEEMSILNAWNIPFFVLMWFLLIYTAAMLMRLANRLSELGERSLRIDLLATHRLSPFMDIGQRTMLLAIGGLSFSLAQGALIGELRIADWLPSTILVLLMAGWLLLRPMWGVHVAIRSARETELARLDAEIGYHDVRGDEVLADPRIEALQRHRERILAVSEWPITRAAWWRPVLYLVIPPLAWVAAALVESMVDAAI